MEFLDILCDQNRANHLLGLDENVFPDDEDEDRDDSEDFDDEDTVFSEDFEDDDSETNTNTNTNTDTYTTTLDGSRSAAAGSESVVPEEHTFQKTTSLFDAIENHYWSTVLNFLTTGSWTKGSSISLLGRGKAAAAPSPKVPLQEEVRTWSVTLDKSGKVTQRRLPLHAALMHKAPFKLVKKLVDLFPGATSCSDSQGNLPLHLAYECAAENHIVTYLLQVYPQADQARNKDGLIPSECADGNSTTQMIQLKGGHKNGDNRDPPVGKAQETKDNAVTGGKLAQIAGLISGTNSNTRMQAEEDAAAAIDDDVDQIKKELDNLRQGNLGSSGDSQHQDQDQSFDDWMKNSFNKFQYNILGITKAPPREEQAEANALATSLLPPIEEFASSEREHDDDDGGSRQLKETPSMGGRWRRSIRRLASKNDRNAMDDDDLSSMGTREESVEVNLMQTRSVSSATTRSQKKKFPFSNPFRKLNKKMAPRTLETVTVQSSTSRDNSRRRKLSAVSLGGINQEMEALSMGGISEQHTEPPPSVSGRSARSKPSRKWRLVRRSNSGKRSRSKSPSRFSFAGSKAGRSKNATSSSEKSSKSSDTPKRGNSIKSPGRFFRKRSYGSLLQNDPKTHSDDNKGWTDAQPKAEDSATKKLKNANGESIPFSNGLSEGEASSVFSWDIVNGMLGSTANKKQPDQTMPWTSFGETATTTPFNPSFLENSLLLSSQNKRTLHEQNKEQFGGSFGKHFLLSSYDNDEQRSPEETMESPEGTFESHMSGDDYDDDCTASSPGEDEDEEMRDDDEEGSISSNSRKSSISQEESNSVDTISEEKMEANLGSNDTSAIAQQFQWPSATPSWFWNDTMQALPVFNDYAAETKLKDVTPSGKEVEAPEQRESEILKASSSQKVGNSSNHKSTDKGHRKMRSLGALVGKTKSKGTGHKRKGSLGSLGAKSEGHRRKASIGSLGGLLRVGKFRGKSGSKSVSAEKSPDPPASETARDSVVSEREVMSARNASEYPDETEKAYLTMQLQQKAIEAMQRAQTTNRPETDIGRYDSRDARESIRTGDELIGYGQGRSGRIQRNTPATPLLPAKSDWRSEYRAYLHSADSGIRANRSNGSSAMLAAAMFDKETNHRRSQSNNSASRSSIGFLGRRKASNKESQRYHASSLSTAGTEEILQDLEQTSHFFDQAWSGFPSSQSMRNNDETFDSTPKQSLKVTSTQSTGPVVSESTVEESDSNNVYLVRVQF